MVIAILNKSWEIYFTTSISICATILLALIIRSKIKEYMKETEKLKKLRALVCEVPEPQRPPFEKIVLEEREMRTVVMAIIIVYVLSIILVLSVPLRRIF